MKRALCSLLLGTLSLGPTTAVIAPVGAQTFSEATDVVVVEVPVQVIGPDGKPVRGLTADNFEVTQGRKKQPLVGFEALDLHSAAAERSTPVAARRHFLMMFDVSFSLPKSILQARGAARELVGQLHPSDLVSVASYSTNKGAQILLGFTGDRAQILGAVERLGLPVVRNDERAADPLGLIAVADLLDTIGKDAESSTSGGGKGRAEIAATEVEQNVAAAYTAQKQITQERAITAMTRSYGDLARIMSGVRGRKHVVLFSEGFDNKLLTGSADVNEQNQMAEGSALWNIDSTARFGSSKITNDVEHMLEEFRRADCIIQAVDIGGLRDGATGSTQWVGGKESLFLMARETGGELFENHNQLGVAVAKVLERTSVTYVLAFQPDVARDGSYHRLDVALKNAPKGSRLVHRPGYYAPRPYDQQSPIEKALAAGQAVLSGEDKESIGTAVLAAPFPAEGGPYVPVLIEVDGPDLLAGMKGKALPLDVYAYAFDPEGRVRAFFSQTLNLDLAKVEPALRASGLKFFGHLDLPPGDWSLRVLVRNGSTGTLGVKVATVHVPDFAATAPLLLSPFFPEPPGKWLIVREAPRKGDRQVAYPFVNGGDGEEQPYIPASMPEVAAGQPSRVSLVGWHLKPGEIRAEARILTTDGREAGMGEISNVQRVGTAADGSERLTASFAAPASLQPGEYVLMVTVTDAGGASETSVSSFVVPGAGGAGGAEARKG